MKSRRALVMLASAGLVAALAGLAGWAASNAAAVEPAEPVTAARFSITVDGVEIASFSELGGIFSGIEPVDLELETGPRPRLKLPGKRTPPTIVLRRGKTQDLSLWTWHEQALADGPSAWKNASLVMYGFDGSPIATYTLTNAWPTKLEIGTLRAGASEVLMETVTIVSERLQRVAP